MDQDFYPWSRVVTCPILRWPNNARVAIAVIVNLDHWDFQRIRSLPARPIRSSRPPPQSLPPERSYRDLHHVAPIDGIAVHVEAQEALLTKRVKYSRVRPAILA